MPTRLRSLFAAWSGTRQPGAESTGATRAGDGTTDAADADRTSGGATDGVAARERDDPPPVQGFLDEPPVSKQGVHPELGLQPAEFLACVVREADGRM